MHRHTETSHDNPEFFAVSVTISIFAVLIAAVSLLGHRAHTHTILAQNRTTDEWVSYEAKAVRLSNYDAMLDLLSVPHAADPTIAASVKTRYKERREQDEREQKELEAKAEALQREMVRQEIAADRFDGGSVCLEAALVITSITALTKRRLFWGIGMVLGCVGLAIATTGFFVR